jgi:metal-responsive CopG/Arc/MetJ family transcriptional regulator
MCMKAIQILMDEALLRELDREAKRRRTDRSKLIRMASARLLEELRRRELEARHRRGYVGAPPDDAEAQAWEAIQEWPDT